MRSIQISSFKYLLILLVVPALALAGCASPETEPPSPVGSDTPLPPTAEDAAPEPTAEVTEAPAPEWTEYYNEAFRFGFSFPSAWYGPDVYEWEAGLRLAVGSDVVYPYGTDRTEQVYTLPDSYYITIDYTLNTQDRTWEDFVASGWIDTYLQLQELEDGGSFSTLRALAIRVSPVSLGQFQGLEYISTLSETAQTERFYVREILAFDQDLNMLRITGSPNLVTISDQANWKADYQRVDEANLERFQAIATSIVIE